MILIGHHISTTKRSLVKESFIITSISMTSIGKPFFNTLVPGLNTNFPVERGSLAVQSRTDLIRNMWGVPTALERNLKVPQYLQPMDMLGAYKDRSFPIPSQLITAAMMNSRASFLTTVAVPIFLTSEVNFVSKQREINQVGFSNIQDHGIPHQQTTREISWSTTLEKYSFTFPISLNLAIDENFGSQEWLFQLAGFAANAQLTVMKEAAYGLTKVAYENLVANNVKNIPFDLSQLLMREAESFCIAAFDQNAFLDMIRRFEDTVPGANLVILPKGGARYISELRGESTSMIVQKIQTNPENGEVMTKIEEMGGPPSIKTIGVGPRKYDFVELQNFKVNDEDDRVEQPLKTCITIAQFYPPDPESDWCQMTPVCDDANDVYLYWQTQTSGDQIRVSYVKALENSFYWDPKTGKVSGYAMRLRDEKNRKVDKTKPGGDDDYLDKAGDHDQPVDTVDILGKTDLRSMKRWRQHYVGLTWDKHLQEWRVPLHLGDFHIRHLPNEAIENCAETFHSALAESIGKGSADSFMNEFYDLMDDISATVPTDEYWLAVAEANAEFTRGPDNSIKGSPTPQDRPAFPAVSRLVEWYPNKFGALNLPRKEGNLRMAYPSGFDSGPGLMTLAKEADNELSEWRDVGLRAKKVLAFLEAFIRTQKLYMPNSAMINPQNTLPWFHRPSDVAAIVDQLRPFKSPLFLALPAVSKDGTYNPITSNHGKTADVEERPLDARDFTLLDHSMSLQRKALNSLDKSIKTKDVITLLRKDIELATSDARKLLDSLMLYIVTETDFQSDKKSSPVKIAEATVVTDHFLKTFIKSDNTGRSFIEEKDKKGANDFITMVLTPSSTKKTNFIEGLFGTKPYSEWYVSKDSAKNDKAKVKEKIDYVINSNRGGRTYEEVKNEIALLEQKRRDEVRLGRPPEEADKEFQQKLTQLLAGTIPNKNQQQNNQQQNQPQQQNQSPIDRRGFGQHSPSEHRSIVVNGDYTYIRAPLMASEGVLRYIHNSPRDPLVLIADHETSYETPIVERRDNSRDYAKFQSQNSESPHFSSLLSTPFAYGMTFSQNEGKTSGTSQFSSKSMAGRGDNNNNNNNNNDIFGLRTQKSTSHLSKGFDMSDYVSLGREYDIDRGENVFSASTKASGSSSSTKGHMAAAMSRQFFGPWDERFRHMRSISSPVTKALFKGLLLSPNELSTFTSVNKSGKKLINVMLVRPFIQQIVSSVIVMEAGSNSAIQAVGHPWLGVTKEDRGIIHTRCDFRTGMVPVTKKNIQMIPYCIPDRFIGGMKVDFMRDHRDFVKPNPEKPSIISMLIPLTERRFEGPIHLLNFNPYYRPDLQNHHLRKWSAAEMFRMVFGDDTTMQIEGHHHNRVNYGTPVVGASLVAHRGPTGYRDFSSMNHRVRYVDGTGPRGDIRMNIDRAWETHNGGSHKFPDYRPHLM
jgi:hypothetical protein